MAGKEGSGRGSPSAAAAADATASGPPAASTALGRPAVAAVAAAAAAADTDTTAPAIPPPPPPSAADTGGIGRGGCPASPPRPASPPSSGVTGTDEPLPPTLRPSPVTADPGRGVGGEKWGPSNDGERVASNAEPGPAGPRSDGLKSAWKESRMPARPHGPAGPPPGGVAPPATPATGAAPEPWRLRERAPVAGVPDADSKFHRSSESGVDRYSIMGGAAAAAREHKTNGRGGGAVRGWAAARPATRPHRHWQGRQQPGAPSGHTDRSVGGRHAGSRSPRQRPHPRPRAGCGRPIPSPPPIPQAKSPRVGHHHRRRDARPPPSSFHSPPEGKEVAHVCPRYTAWRPHRVNGTGVEVLRPTGTTGGGVVGRRERRRRGPGRVPPRAPPS